MRLRRILLGFGDEPTGVTGLLENGQDWQEIDAAVRVIVVSADVQDSSREMAVSGGASGFINKPVDRAGLLTAIAKALEATA